MSNSMQSAIDFISDEAKEARVEDRSVGIFADHALADGLEQFLAMPAEIERLRAILAELFDAETAQYPSDPEVESLIARSQCQIRQNDWSSRRHAARRAAEIALGRAPDGDGERK